MSSQGFEKLQVLLIPVLKLSVDITVIMEEQFQESQWSLSKKCVFPVLEFSERFLPLCIHSVHRCRPSTCDNLMFTGNK